jgi:hypothetical protein
MKTKILMLFLCVSLAGKSQINLENSYLATSASMNLQIIELVKWGYKYQLLDVPNASVKLYNLNHSIFKTINLTIPPGHNLYAYPMVSDSLFDTDNLLEVAYSVVAYNFSTTPASYTYVTNVVKETGSTLITIPQGVYPNIAYAGAAAGYKMIVNVDSVNKPTLKQINVYSLAGGLPMHITQGGGTITDVSPLKPASGFISSPVPNPSNGKTIVGYQLPPGESIGTISIYDVNGKELKSYKVDNTFSTLELDNSDLPSGTYFYTMAGSSEAKKMLIIK